MTGQEQLTYVGHSDGTTQMFAGASLNPDYFSSKVNLFVAMGPVVKVSHSEPFNQSLAKTSDYWREMQFLIKKLGAYNILDANWEEEEALQLFCGTEIGLPVCQDFIQGLAGETPEVDNWNRFNILLKDYPAG